MKLSWQMRQTLNRVPDEGVGTNMYGSSLDPLFRRGLIEKPRLVPVQITVHHYTAQLTALGRRVKYQNTDD